jgi:hypothetical protein
VSLHPATERIRGRVDFPIQEEPPHSARDPGIPQPVIECERARSREFDRGSRRIGRGHLEEDRDGMGHGHAGPGRWESRIQIEGALQERDAPPVAFRRTEVRLFGAEQVLRIRFRVHGP